MVSFAELFIAFLVCLFSYYNPIMKLNAALEDGENGSLSSFDGRPSSSLLVSAFKKPKNAISFDDEHAFTKLKLSWFTAWKQKLSSKSSISSSSNSYRNPREWSVEEDWAPLIDTLVMANLRKSDKGYESYCDGRITLHLHQNMLHIAYRMIEPPRNQNAELFIYQYTTDLWKSLIKHNPTGLAGHVFGSKYQKVHVAIGHAAAVATLMSARIAGSLPKVPEIQQLVCFDSPEEGLIIHGAYHSAAAWIEMKRHQLFPTSINFSYSKFRVEKNTLYDYTFYLPSPVISAAPSYVEDIDNEGTLFVPSNADVSLRDEILTKLKSLKYDMQSVFSGDYLLGDDDDDVRELRRLPQIQKPVFQERPITEALLFLKEYLERTFEMRGCFVCESSMPYGKNFEIQCSLNDFPIVVYEASLDGGVPLSEYAGRKHDSPLIKSDKLSDQLSAFYTEIAKQTRKFSLLFRSLNDRHSDYGSFVFPDNFDDHSFVFPTVMLTIRPIRNDLLYSFSQKSTEVFHRLFLSPTFRWTPECSSIFIQPVGKRNNLLEEDVLLDFLKKPTEGARLSIVCEENQISLLEIANTISDKKRKLKGVDCSHPMNQWNRSVCPSYCQVGGGNGSGSFCMEVFTIKTGGRRVYFAFSKVTKMDTRLNDLASKMPSSLGNLILRKDPPFDGLTSYRFSHFQHPKFEYSFDSCEENWAQ